MLKYGQDGKFYVVCIFPQFKKNVMRKKLLMMCLSWKYPCVSLDSVAFWLYDHKLAI